MDPTAVKAWVDLVVNHGAAFVITAVVIGLGAWGVVTAVNRMFGKEGLIWWAADRLLGDEGYVSQVVDEHRTFVKSMSENSIQTKEMVKGAFALSELHLDQQKRTHELIATCGGEFCDAVELAAEKLGIKEDIAGQLRSIRNHIAYAGKHEEERHA